MKAIKAFGYFWYEFIIGDDPKIAVAVVVALALVVGALKAKLLGDTGLAIVGAALIVALFSLSLAIDVRGSGK